MLDGELSASDERGHDAPLPVGARTTLIVSVTSTASIAAQL
jgi:hypothetical protein